MATITFLPDRLNAPPIVFRGFTTPELFTTALFGVVIGLVVAVPITLLLGWLAFPTLGLLMPLAVIIFGGKLMARFKRGKPENYIYRYIEYWLGRQGLSSSRLITQSQSWSLRRSRYVIRCNE